MECSTEGCHRDVHARGFCSSCYARAYHAGSLKRVRNPMRPRGMSVEDWLPTALVEIPGPMTTPCQIWPRQVGNNGYGKLTVGGKTLMPHRLAWSIANGPIPKNRQVNHKCDNKLCCNADHMYIGTQAENRRDAAKNDQRGEQRYNAVLTEALVCEIRVRHADGESYRSIADDIGVGYAAVAAAGTRRTWRHVE